MTRKIREKTMSTVGMAFVFTAAMAVIVGGPTVKYVGYSLRAWLMREPS